MNCTLPKPLINVVSIVQVSAPSVVLYRPSNLMAHPSRPLRKNKELMADLGGEIGRFYTELMSDQRLRTAMEMIATYMQNSLDAIAITDREGRTLNVNPAFERLYGWKFEEIRGRPLPTVPPASEMDYRRNVEGALNGNSKRFDAVRIRKDGSPVEVSISLFPLLNETGGIYAVASSTRDMTESKMLRNVLLLHDAVLRNSPYMFLILDSDSASGNRVEFANSSFLEMAGATEADATGKAFNLVLEKLVSRSELGAVLDSISRHNRYSGDLQLKRPAGPSIWVHLDVSPVKGEDGRLSHWVCGMKDETEVITSRAQLREANEKFKLVANLDRHDIRNCLHSILTFAEVGILSDHDEGTTRSFRGIRDAARRISDHIDQFRNIQDSIDGEGAQWQDLADVVSRALSGFDLKDIDLITNVGETEIHSTPFLEKVFHNLIDNSMRHGSHVTRISISAVSDGAVHKIVYGDDGIGIQDDAKKSLFSGRLADRSMHGLGLVSGLLESCGMSICESGEYGKGARFEITVPAVSFRNPKVQHVAEV